VIDTLVCEHKQHLHHSFHQTLKTTQTTVNKTFTSPFTVVVQLLPLSYNKYPSIFNIKEATLMANQTTATVYQIIEDGYQKTILHNHTEDAEFNGKYLTLGGKKTVNFGSCSYLGLEHHPQLVQGAIEAIQNFGTQFSSSRTYLSIGLLKELEDHLYKIFENPLLVTPSTTMGHLATLPIVVEDEDAVILDMQVHSSVQMAAQLLKARGINMTIVRHNDMEALEKKVCELRPNHKKIWYLADGVYSMYGDFAPLEKIIPMMNQYPELHLYIDDAHGMSWAGKNGRGYVRSQITHHKRMVLAVSLNKSFACGGGCIIFPSEEMRKKVLFCGGTLIFSGPLQPPMVGAALASAKLHLSQEIITHQRQLADSIHYLNQKLHEAHLPQVVENESPIFFIPVGLPKHIAPMIKHLKDDGFLVNSASFPATTMKRGGVRFMVTCHHTKADIDHLVDRLLFHYHTFLEESGFTESDIARNFRIPNFTLKPICSQAQLKVISQTTSLNVFYERSIQNIDRVEWDHIHADKGTLSHAALRALQSTFGKGKQPEDQWEFHYVRIKDLDGKTVLSTFYTVALVKDDIFSPETISRVIEEKRKKDPYYLNSKVVTLGSMITKGEHLYLDRSHSEWKKALQILIDQMQKTSGEVQASRIMFREFYGDLDSELKTTMLEKGFTVFQLPNNVSIKNTTWKCEEEYLQCLKGRYRSDFRREILKYENLFEVETEKPTTHQERQACYQLYTNVFERAYEMNMHKLPFEYFEVMCEHKSFDIIRLYLKDHPSAQNERKPVGVMFSYFEANTYYALLVGIDYTCNQSHGVYKQALYQTVKRANQIGAKNIDLAFTAELVKKKVGAHPEKTWAFVQLLDTYNLQIIDTISQMAQAS